MTRYKIGETTFTVGVNDDQRGSVQCKFPRPLWELMGKPKQIAFTIKGDEIHVSKATKKKEVFRY